VPAPAKPAPVESAPAKTEQKEPEVRAASSASGADAAKKDSPPAGGAAGTDGDIQVTVVPGIARYHLPDCILIRFLAESDLETMTRQAAETASCIPCKACRPDK
jgi:hypothetical protein